MPEGEEEKKRRKQSVLRNSQGRSIQRPGKNCRANLRWMYARHQNKFMCVAFIGGKEKGNGRMANDMPHLLGVRVRGDRATACVPRTTVHAK
jgi:hypothetical protein